MTAQTLQSEVVHALETGVLAWLATVSPDGWPNVSPKEIFAPFPAQAPTSVVIAEIASPISLGNLRANPRACLSVVDIFKQRGFKLRGEVTIIAPDDAAFTKASAPLFAQTRGQYPLRHILQLEVTGVNPIAAPSYHLFPERTEAERVADALKTYGVRWQE